jgi:pimeloyl-ACP methyl ester carboxylesterase
MSPTTQHVFVILAYVLVVVWRLRRIRLRWQLPLMHGPDYLMGLRVPPGFMEETGARLIANYRRWLILPWAVELVSVVTVIFIGHFYDWTSWLIIAFSLLDMATWLLLLRHTRMQVKPFAIEVAPTPIALPLQRRELRSYTRPWIEITIGATLVTCFSLIIWHGGDNRFRIVLTLAYVQLGLLLIKRGLVDWRTRVPVENAEGYHQLQESRRTHFIHECDWIRGFATLFTVILTVSEFFGATAGQWMVVVWLALALVMMSSMARDSRRLLQLATALKPLKPKRVWATDVHSAFLYRPDFPAMFVRRQSGFAINFGSPRTMITTAYLAIGVILVAAALRADESVMPPGKVPLEKCTSAGVSGMCGSFEVFENRSTRSGRKLKLRFMTLPARATTKEPDAVFAIAGGPGQGSIDAFPNLGYVDKLREKRDVVLVDQRGTGASNRLDCDLTGGMANEFSQVFAVDNIKRCRAQLEKIADLRQYSTSTAMDDLDDVRAALGYDQVNLLGGSYGTRAALEYLRRHGDHVRTVMIKGVAPPGYKLPLPFAKTIQESMEHLFVDCAADPTCKKAYPDLRADFDNALARLQKSPAAFKLPAADLDVKLTREIFIDSLRPVLYIPQFVAMMPSVIHQAAQGDFAAYGRLYYQLLVALEKGVARGMFLSVTCGEDVPFITDAEAKEQTAGTWLGDFRVRTQRQMCAAWPRGNVAASFHDPVRSDKPVLMISGDEDPATPPSYANEAAKSLPNSRHIVIKGGTHGTESPCLDGLVAQFVGAGSAKGLNETCVASIRRPAFVVP